MTAVLSVRRLCVHYGGVQALKDVDLEVHPRKLTALIGPNGAGKTTLVDAVTGFTRCTGKVFLRDQDISRLGPSRRAWRGLSRTFQAGELFADLTVHENLNVAASRLTPWQTIKGVARGRAVRQPGVDQALRVLGIEDLADRRPDELTQGQRKLVGVARAIAPQPAVVLLDEPAAGLDSDESVDLGERLRRVVDSGIPVLLIDHDMNLVLKASDHVVVLDFGEVIGRGDPQVIAQDGRVIQAYLGQYGAPAETAAR